MAFDETLADRVRAALAPRRDVEEKRMFGGVALMVRGHMCVGVEKDRLLVRLSHEEADAALGEPHVIPMEFTGRRMRGFVFVTAPGVRTAAQVRRWVARAITHNAAQPAKAPGTAKPARRHK